MPPIPLATVKPGYKPQAEDTSIDIDVLQFNLLRKLSPLKRVERFISLNRSSREFALVNNPPEFARTHYLRRRLGEEWLNKLINPEGAVVIEDPIAFTRKIAAILKPIGIPYYVGGSVASSLLGENRNTEDLDLVIEVSDIQIPDLIQAFLAEDFYISEGAVSEAVRSPHPFKSFNIVDNETIEKADIFILKSDPFSRSKMNRRCLIPISNKGSIYVCSAEDIILQKLLWAKVHNNDSQKQKRDILGVLKLQRNDLDYGYLVDWAARLELVEALNQSFQEAGI
ncbi:MAG: hypothetical protein KME16_14965 [Scytolyngbya sp. HA4215-MV1]|nr:hypothetical protein [Scytolyngbya sp. HA4215-MV1]